MSEIARSFKENITLKKTIDRLLRNLNHFNDTQLLMNNYLSQVKQHISDDYSVIIIDNSDISKPYSTKLEALTDIRDGSTGEIVKGYQTIEAAVLANNGKMPLPVYEKVFSAAEKGFISEPMKNYAVWNPSQKTLEINVSELWTEALMRMIITGIF